MIKTVFACSGWRNAVALPLIAAWLIGCSPLELDGGARAGVTEPPPATVETGATPIPTDSGYPGPGTAVPPATIVPTAAETPPYLLVTPKPITYSLESTVDWLPYENSRLGLSLKYPETPPQVIEERGGEWTRVVISIRTGPTLPAVWANIAVIEISVYPNPDDLSLLEFLARSSREYGGLSPR
ncbi:MAG: hypothetical protein NZM11_11935, partial [Anaerolineales bacterium]|nr:hypothetical protein [Anaerolineales bacterium]